MLRVNYCIVKTILWFWFGKWYMHQPFEAKQSNTHPRPHISKEITDVRRGVSDSMLNCGIIREETMWNCTTKLIRKADHSGKRSGKCFKVTKEATKSDRKMLFKLWGGGDIDMPLPHHLICWYSGDISWTIAHTSVWGKVEMQFFFFFCGLWSEMTVSELHFQHS